MGTTTSTGSRNPLSLNLPPIEAERQLTPRGRAIAELERNGIDWENPPNASTIKRIALNCQEPVGADFAEKQQPLERLESRSLKLLRLHPHWPLGLFARTLGCSITGLRAIDSFSSRCKPRHEAVAAFLRGETPAAPTTIEIPAPAKRG